MASSWEGGEREGFPWRRLGLALLVVALVGAVVVVSRRDRGLSFETSDDVVEVASEEVDVVVTGPLEAGDRWYCPSGHLVRAFDDGFYYPPGYPEGLDDLGRPSACYVDTQRAEQDGFTLAPPPEGAVLAGDVYVVDASSPTPGGCRNVAQSSPIPVPCPAKLPAPANASSCAYFDQCRFGDGVIIELREFTVPPDWCGGCETDLVITAAANQQVPLVTCDRAARFPPLPTHPGVLFLDCPVDQPPWVPGIGGYPHAGNTMTAWRRGDVTYALSVGGFGEAQREVLTVVGDGIDYVEAAAPPVPGP